VFQQEESSLIYTSEREVNLYAVSREEISVMTCQLVLMISKKHSEQS